MPVAFFHFDNKIIVNDSDIFCDEYLWNKQQNSELLLNSGGDLDNIMKDSYLGFLFSYLKRIS